MKIDKGTAQLIVVIVILAVWVLGLVIASFDGNVMLKATTPMLTVVFGWLFAAKVTESA